jgi:hypothetical protein
MKRSFSTFISKCLAVAVVVGVSAKVFAEDYERVAGTFCYGLSQEVLSIVNRERRNQGLGRVIMTEYLTDAAMKRAAEIVVVFSHTRPNGETCFSAISDAAFPKGENIAYGYVSPAHVMEGWMDSPGHRENILTEEFTAIGIGCFYSDGAYYWVQVFSGGSGEVETRTDERSAIVDVSLVFGQDSKVIDGAVPPSCQQTYRIQFDANGGSLPSGGKMAAQTMTYGKAAKLQKNAFTRSGCVFIGWAKFKNGKVVYKNGQTVKNLTAKGKTIALYAKWARKNYKVKFYANGGKGKMKTLSLIYGKAKKLSSNKFKSPKGKRFAGWATSRANAQKGVVKYRNRQSVKNLVTTGKTVKLYAVWKEQ